MLAKNWVKRLRYSNKAVTYLEYLDLVVQALCLQVVIFSVAEYPILKTTDVKKGEAKKVQITERLKGVKSLEEKIYQQGCVELQHIKQVK